MNLFLGSLFIIEPLSVFFVNFQFIHFHPMFHLCRNQAVSFYQQNLWKNLCKRMKTILCRNGRYSSCIFLVIWLKMFHNPSVLKTIDQENNKNSNACELKLILHNLLCHNFHKILLIHNLWFHNLFFLQIFCSLKGIIVRFRYIMITKSQLKHYWCILLVHIIALSCMP